MGVGGEGKTAAYEGAGDTPTPVPDQFVYWDQAGLRRGRTGDAPGFGDALGQGCVLSPPPPPK